MNINRRTMLRTLFLAPVAAFVAPMLGKEKAVMPPTPTCGPDQMAMQFSGLHRVPVYGKWSFVSPEPDNAAIPFPWPFCVQQYFWDGGQMMTYGPTWMNYKGIVHSPDQIQAWAIEHGLMKEPPPGWVPPIETRLSAERNCWNYNMDLSKETAYVRQMLPEWRQMDKIKMTGPWIWGNKQAPCT
jgi:hypothetical protein